MLALLLAVVVQSSDSAARPNATRDTLHSTAIALAVDTGVVDSIAVSRTRRPLFAPLLLPYESSFPVDTIRPRKKAVVIEYSDWYERRLTIHRYASWAMLPIFVGQYVTGSTLVAKGTDAPQWVKSTHPILASGVLGLFATNTITGSMNWWEGRADPSGRTWRTAHSVLMLLADAGFVYVGSISAQAKQSGDVRTRHRTAAIVSGSLALGSWIMMLKPFRRD
jgi:hypothetical protein